MATTPVSQIQEYQTGFAEPIRPYAEELLGKAQVYTDPDLNPYMQYMGDRVAQFTPLQQQSYENAALMQTAPQLGDATAMAGMAGLGCSSVDGRGRGRRLDAATCATVKACPGVGSVV